MNYIIESIQDNIVRLESDCSDFVVISIDVLPAGVKEGDVLTFDGKDYFINFEATEKRRKDLYIKFENLFHKK